MARDLRRATPDGFPLSHLYDSLRQREIYGAWHEQGSNQISLRKGHYDATQHPETAFGLER